MVGVHSDAGGQSPSHPVWHVCSGGLDVGVGMQSPPQTSVCVQIEPVGHSPGLPNTQGIVYIGPGVVEVVVGGSAAKARGNKGSKNINLMIVVIVLSNFITCVHEMLSVIEPGDRRGIRGLVMKGGYFPSFYLTLVSKTYRMRGGIMTDLKEKY